MTEEQAVEFWHWTGTIGIGHESYARGRVGDEGPFTNPARMIEDIMGHSTDRSEFVDHNDCESDFWARVWAHAGWWDIPQSGQRSQS